MTGNSEHQHPAAGHSFGPTGPGSVILELGEHTGALIIATPPHLVGHEIEISPAGDARRTHSLVRERHTASGTSYAAVYPSLPAADYTIWRDATTPAGRVTVQGRQATRYRWPEVTPASAA